MQKLLLLFAAVFLLSPIKIEAQQQLYPLQSFYKDRLFFQDTTKTTAHLEKSAVAFRYSGACFFPETEENTLSIQQLTDNTPRKNWFARKLFNEHFFEIKREKFKLYVDPLLGFSMGKDFNDQSLAYTYQNTRGFQIKGEIGKKISFITNLRENQQRFVAYQTQYILQHGEWYPNDSSVYQLRNGFVPGAARTKPFKNGGFDFAYATGAFTYAPIRQLRISFGNNMHFVGAGYRSLLLSDNSANFPYLQFSYRINAKLSGEVIYAQQLNLIRTLKNSTPEALFEKKGYTVHYFTYQPIASLSIGFFEGTTWSRGDSAQSKRVNAWYYNPLPILSTAFLGTQSKWSNTVLGLNALYSAPAHLAFYAQFAINQLHTFHPAFQLGLRWSAPFSVKNLYLQAEWNTVPDYFYQNVLHRMNYTHNNLPLAHPMGAGFSENVFRANYEWKRCSFAYQSNLYFTQYDIVNQQFGTPIYPNAFPKSAMTDKGNLLLQEFTFAYRFNRSNNLQLYFSVLYRKGFFAHYQNETCYFGIGLKTDLNNQYFDF
jgi:hypothetical protein